eukprot:TRINITY_DN6728_c0_g1_i1.p1 TRINITY_DN6728_c0_g1~~TRINITY_DN6728_c0_g1_i1.p1  ORF type:complete len:687 (-),score=245.71 TRINITY_DN6728_c0_g1_i1:581-2521(-)
MCGITAYIGQRQALEILIKGLQRLEYRGYDSAGVCILNNQTGEMEVRKSVGKVKELLGKCGGSTPNISGSLGIAHTRWATHGAPSNRNSHPHLNTESSIACVHNGIIENYIAIRTQLESKGYVMQSDTDTEVLVHLVSDVMKNRPALTLRMAVSVALRAVVGTYGVCFIDKKHPNILVGARRGSPLLLGIGEGEYILASDASAVIEHTRQVIYLEDNDVVEIDSSKNKHEIYSIEHTQRHSAIGALPGSPMSVDPEMSSLSSIVRQVNELEMDLASIEKSGHKHFMLKEILEQPTVLENCMRGRVNGKNGTVRLGGIAEVIPRIVAADRILICACGTSWHAAQVGEYLIEKLARKPVEVEYASEFRYRDPILTEKDVVIVISQSGETADTLAAVRLAKERGALVLGLVNVVGSTIARETDAGVYLHVGPEIGVASTKAFTGQVCVLTMMSLMLAYESGKLNDAELKEHVDHLVAIPNQMRQTLEESSLNKIRDIAAMYRYASSFLYLGRGFNFPVALEGALKLKEISYIHAEGYPSAEMKHGPIALIDRFMPVVIIAPSNDPVYEKILSAVEEVHCRKGVIVAITDDEGNALDTKCEFVIRIPKTESWLAPLLTVLPLQLISYYIADMRGCDIDQPRNLAKSVTVE